MAKRYPPGGMPPEANPLDGEVMPPAPVHVLYLPGQGLRPHVPADPTMPSLTLESGWDVPKGGKVPGWGVSPRMLIFARLTASGVSGREALGAAFPLLYGQKNRARQAIRRASRIMANPAMRETVRRLRELSERARRQETTSMRDFVLARLTHEAQTAPEASARIKALDLLGKSEAMWTTVIRQEQASTPEALENLKSQLEQRLRVALTKLGVAPTPDGERGNGPREGEAEPHPGGTPLIARGTRPTPDDTIPPTQVLTSPGPIREVTPEDLGL